MLFGSETAWVGRVHISFQRGELPVPCRREVIWNPSIGMQQALNRGFCAGFSHADARARQPNKDKLTLDKLIVSVSIFVKWG